MVTARPGHGRAAVTGGDRIRQYLGPAPIGRSSGYRDAMNHLPLLYIDPAAGSLVIQAVIAAALAVPFMLRERIGSLIRKVRRLHDV